MLYAACRSLTPRGKHKTFHWITNNSPCRQPVSICLLNCRYDCIPRWVSFSFSPFDVWVFFTVLVSVAKSLGYKISRPSNSQMTKTSPFEFNYEMRYSMQPRKQDDMWNICWTDSIVAVDFCREMRRFQKINVSWRVGRGSTSVKIAIYNKSSWICCSFKLNRKRLKIKLIPLTAFSWNVRNLPQRSPGTKPQPDAETVPQRLQYLPKDLVLSSGVRATSVQAYVVINFIYFVKSRRCNSVQSPAQKQDFHRQTRPGLPGTWNLADKEP